MPVNIATNRYKVKGLLGDGGMGTVYRALDTRTNTYVALETLREPADPTMLQMFKRVRLDLAKVPHPNIGEVGDVDEIEEDGVRKSCLITPLLPGTTLATLIQSSSPRLTTDFVVNLVVQVCRGLQAAHEMGLIHGDLKPGNIFIMDDDTVKIIDFGLVYTIENKSANALKGTFQYMPPEQLDGTAQPNRSFDIFSLGVVAYEALALHQPFKRGTFRDTAEAIRNFVPQAISERNSKVSQLISKAVQVAMAKHPSYRYATAHEFAETLQKAQHDQPIERFDPAVIRPRIDRAQEAFNGGDSNLACGILNELAAEGNLDTAITHLRSQIDEANKQRRIRQLLTGAQTRIEQEEALPALEELEEILELDPQNLEARTLRKQLEEQRSKQQASEWLHRARNHFDHGDFNEARRALKEVFNLRYDDPDAVGLKAQLDSREKEVEMARTEISQLYTSALRDSQVGEVGAALSKLEKLRELSRNVAGACIPERDKVFQTLYNDLCAERDRINNSYSEGTRELSENSFEKALEICRAILVRYPQNQKFHVLRLKVEQSQRQQLSSYIAEVGGAVDTEPNLDRRVGLLEEACKRYPGQFSSQLSLARELRDLVTSIVAKARAYEERGQFVEAIAQWTTLSDLHPLYPDIDVEINRLERRREQHSEEDKKSRLIGKINRALGSSGYADAERLSLEALLEFPQNSELLTLLRLSQEGVERNREANRLFEEAKAILANGDSEQAIALLRQAHDLDRDNSVIVNALVDLLVEHAHTLLDKDASAAEPSVMEAKRLDPERSSVKDVVALLARAKGKEAPAQSYLQETPTHAKNEEPSVSGATDIDLELESYARLVTVPEESPIVAPPIQPPASPIQPAPPKPPSPSNGPRIVQQIREAGELFVQNVESRLGIEYRNVVGLMVGCLVSFIILGLTLLYINRPHPALVADGQANKPAVADQAQSKDLLAPGSSGHEATNATSDAASNSPSAGQTETLTPAKSPAVDEDPGGSFATVGDSQPQSRDARPGEVTDLGHAISTAPILSRVGISVTPKTAKLFIDDRPVRPQKPGVWVWTAASGLYQCRLTAEGMNDETFTITLKKGIPFNRRVDMTPKGPPVAPLTITGGTPGSTVSLDDSAIGQLDDKGGFAYSGVASGTHTIQLSKPGYSSRTFYGQVFVPGKAFDLPGDKQLSVEAGYARVTVTPAHATVAYKRSDETDKHPVSDLSKALTLQPGDYEFAAAALNHSASIIQVRIQANQTASVAFDLQPIKVKETKMEFVNMDEVIKKNGEWYHGRTDKYIRLMTNDSTNTILFSKEFKVKKMAWQISVGGNTITYKLDAKGISITRNIDGVETTERVKDDFSSTNNPSASYAATIKLERNEVIMARQDGTLVNTLHDDKHNWLQAQIFAKGDTYFSFSPGH
jgi:serine/threonine protein kinase